MSVKFGDIAIEKLKGSSNFHIWKFNMENFLITKELGNCISNPVTEVKVELLSKAKGFLALSVDTSIQSHIQGLNTPKQIWDHLKKLFEDSGLSRRIALLRQLTSLRLEACEGIRQIYVTSSKE